MAPEMVRAVLRGRGLLSGSGRNAVVDLNRPPRPPASPALSPDQQAGEQAGEHEADDGDEQQQQDQLAVVVAVDVQCDGSGGGGPEEEPRGRSRSRGLRTQGGGQTTNERVAAAPQPGLDHPIRDVRIDSSDDIATELEQQIAKSARGGSKRKAR